VRAGYSAAAAALSMGTPLVALEHRPLGPALEPSTSSLIGKWAKPWYRSQTRFHAAASSGTPDTTSSMLPYTAAGAATTASCAVGMRSTASGSMANAVRKP
jgi:hypothetical protein